MPRELPIDSLQHNDFTFLLKSPWLVLSNLGGIAVEISTLGQRLLALRDFTERSEAVEIGFARLVPTPEPESVTSG